MKPWTIPITCVTIAFVVFGSAWLIHGIIYSEEEARTSYYLEIKTDDLDPESLRAHFSTNYPNDFSVESLEKILQALEEYPGGQLFHFNTPKKVWRNRGGESGYAIHSRDRIVWRFRLGVS